MNRGARCLKSQTQLSDYNTTTTKKDLPYSIGNSTQYSIMSRENNLKMSRNMYSLYCIRETNTTL